MKMKMKRAIQVLCIGVLLAGVVAGGTTIADAKAPANIQKGVYLEDLDISGMTGEQARAEAETYVESMKQCVLTLQGQDGGSVDVTAGELGLTWNNPEIIDNALNLGQTGNVVARYKELTDAENNGCRFDMELALDEELTRTFIENNSAILGKEARNAGLSRVDGEFVITEGVAGVDVDIEATIASMEGLLDTNRGAAGVDVELVTVVTDPAGTSEQLAQVKDLLGTFTTSYKTSSKDRSANVANGARLIDGTVLFPGEEFSTYEAVKPFTAANGYYMAGSYLNGMVVDSMGGGICQVSTTLYNAVLRAELEITERNSHSMIVTYADISADAAIAESSGKDFTFVNNTEYPIYIEAFTTTEKKVTFNIYGVETRDENRTVEFENEIIQTIQPDYERIIPDPNQGVGYVSVQSAHVGYKAKLWKIVKVNGEEVERIQVNSSSYAMSPRTAVVGINTANPQRLAEINAAIATANIDHVKGVAAALYAQEVAEAAGTPAE